MNSSIGENLFEFYQYCFQFNRIYKSFHLFNMKIFWDTSSGMMAGKKNAMCNITEATLLKVIPLATKNMETHKKGECTNQHIIPCYMYYYHTKSTGIQPTHCFGLNSCEEINPIKLIFEC